MSIGSIVMSLLQVRQHRNKFRHTAADAARYLTSKTHPKYGLETCVRLYALPYALLMWSTLAFVVAVGLLCFQNTSTVVRATVGGSVAVVGALTCWCIYTAWEINEWSWWTRITELVMEQSKKLGWRSACALITGRQVVRPNGSPDHV
ncbi:hypothetical protein PUNSTDRAFT_113939 [Punctularia strigosozonata HHB-11173 SS5]|uniref:uncharacterized protein n=1 Tax=Punctularia strigosozonata (strain HHB-11173) TaxID=741275 RepID=UPI0004416EEA|nr:uncharacterized protein PUNSTDRAFT_113939 [Punctularia strigosozonata HHB-11173 SS5]EIN08403.1 hypothetical protein PUNSTDRAFT_113939 [Punctularia strigosozonata HHB-11173 SS5]